MKNKTLQMQKMAQIVIISLVILSLLVVALIFGIQRASAAITTQLDLGSQGEDVRELQTYLATNASIYPSGLITGYFGPLTQAAVQRFQVAQGIVTSGTPATTGYGRVGPQTMARINTLMGAGVTVSWDTVPVLSPVTLTTTRTSATFAWTTNEPTQGQVYYSTVALRADEATGPRQVPFISGTAAVATNSLQTGHTIMVQNLQPDTVYYYLVRNIDSAGNITMIWPTTFRTSR